MNPDRISEFEIESGYIYYESEDLTTEFVPLSTPTDEVR